MRKFLIVYRIMFYSIIGVILIKLLFNREIRLKIFELMIFGFVDSQVRDKDVEMKQRRIDYVDERRGV